MNSINFSTDTQANFKNDIKKSRSINSHWDDPKRNVSFKISISLIFAFFGYVGSAYYFNLFPFKDPQNQFDQSPSLADPKNFLKPLDMCLIDDASQWPFLQSPNVCEDDDIQINNCRTLHQPTYSVQHWQNLTTFNKDEQDFFNLRIMTRRYRMSEGICYGFSAYFLATPTEKFFDQLHEFSYSDIDYKKVYDDYISLKQWPQFSEHSDLFIYTISLYQIMQTNQNNLIEIPPLIDFCFAEIVPIDKLPIMLDQLSDSQKIKITNRSHAIAIQKIKYDTGEFAYLCIDYNLPGQFSPKSLDQAVDFITTMIGDPNRSKLEGLQYYEVHSNGPLKEYTNDYVTERFLLMVHKGRLDQIKHFINTNSMNKLDESNAILTAAKYSQFDVFKYLLSHFSLDDFSFRTTFLYALSLAIGNENHDFLHKLFLTNDIAVDKFLKLESGYITNFKEFNLLELCLENVEWLLDILIDDYQLKDCLQSYNFRFRNEPDRLRFRGEIVEEKHHFFQVSALHMAVYFSKKWAVGQPLKYRSINKLLESGASASIMTMTRISAFSPIHLAIDINDPHVLSILLPHASTRHLFNEFHPYLWFAAEKKSSQMIQLLMDKFRESDDYWSQFYLIENFMGAYVGGLKSLICNNIGKYDVDVFKFLLNHAHFSEDQLNDLKLDPIFKDPKNSEYLTVINDQLSTVIA